MVRMTDLLKKAQKQLEVIKGRGEDSQVTKPSPRQLPPEPKLPSEPEKPPVLRPEPPPPKKPKPEIRKEPPPKKEQEPIEFSEVFMRHEKEQTSPGEIASMVIGSGIPDEEQTKKIYFDSITGVKKIFDAYKSSGSIDKKEIMDIVQSLANNILLGSHILLRLFHESDSLEGYIYYNAVNVGILSVEIGSGFNYNKSTLVDLAVIGLLHDIDLITSMHIIDKAEKLNKDELKEIKKHPLTTAIFVNDTFGFSKGVINGILFHHKRRNGQDYPADLTDPEFQDLAEIVGIADTYESMTHSRPHKQKMSAYAAVLNIISTCKELFSSQLIKALVSRVGLYPIGTWAQLNTGEICRILEINPDFPTRPIVSLLMDKDKRKLREIRTIDLQKMPSLYIKNAITDIAT